MPLSRHRPSPASSSPITSPCSPRVHVTTVTGTPAAAYRAIVPPVARLSSSGCACTSSRPFSTIAPSHPAHAGSDAAWAPPGDRRRPRYVRASGSDDLAPLGGVTRGHVAGGTDLEERRFLDGADVLRLPAPGAE